MPNRTAVHDVRARRTAEVESDLAVTERDNTLISVAHIRIICRRELFPHCLDERVQRTKPVPLVGATFDASRWHHAVVEDETNVLDAVGRLSDLDHKVRGERRYLGHFEGAVGQDAVDWKRLGGQRAEIESDKDCARDELRLAILVIATH
jgi:hypothetical protein